MTKSELRIQFEAKHPLPEWVTWYIDHYIGRPPDDVDANMRHNTLFKGYLSGYADEVEGAAKVCYAIQTDWLNGSVNPENGFEAQQNCLSYRMIALDCETKIRSQAITD